MTTNYYKKYERLINEYQQAWKKRHPRKEFPYRVETKYSFDTLDPFVRKQLLAGIKVGIKHLI